MAGPRVVVSATFTAEPLRETLEFFLRLLRWDHAVDFAPFGQVFQTLLDPQSLFAQNASGVNVLLIRADDLTAFGAVEQLVAALRSGTLEQCPLLIRVCPSASGPPPWDLEEVLRSELVGDPRIRVLSASLQDQMYPVAEVHDAQARALAAIPYTAEYFTALGASLVREMHRMRATPFKVIAVDCDDTLWSGICGEDGPGGVTIDAPRRALQALLVDQQANGRLLAIASKNNANDVLEVFRQHPEMPLRLDHFVARRIDWNGKASSIRALAGDLGLATDSFLFVDDNPKETAEVSAELPEVVALTLPADPLRIPQFLSNVWAFDLPENITGEDRNRTASYAQNAERAVWERDAVDLKQFISGLELVVEIQRMRESDLARAAQLTQRTNQMNFSGRRRTEAELQAFLGFGTGFTVRVRDRFGDYGFVGLILLEESEDALVIDTFLLSCRALGRGVEHRMLRAVGAFALERGLSDIITLFERTDRNTPAQVFLAGITDFSPAALAMQVYDPSSTRSGQETARVPHHRVETARPADYNRIAELRHVSDILDAIREEKLQATSLSAGGEAPRTDLERHLCGIWSEMLAVPQVHIHDNFFDLGGHSLLAVQLVARLHRDLAIDLPLEAVYTGTLTVAELARSIELFQQGKVDDPEYDALLAELENMTEEEAEALLAREMDGEPQP